MTTLYKNHLNGDQVNVLLILIPLFAVLLINTSCIYVPIPASELRSPKGVIDKKTIKSLKQGESTRADLLLLVGEPDARYEQDRYFVYEWEASEALVVVPGAGDTVSIKHYFCVEFDENNRIKRCGHIKSGLFKNTNEAQNEVYEWMFGSNK